MTGVRQPVHDLGAEAAVLSSALLSRAALVEVRAVLPAPEAFYSDANRRIWQAACAIDDAGEVADLVTVAGELQRAGRLEQVGGAGYLAQISDATPAVAHVEAHARIVLDLWRQRRMVAECQRIAAEGQVGDLGSPVGEWLASAAGAVAAVADDSGSRDTLVTAREAVDTTWPVVSARANDDATPPGIPTGFRDLDRRLGGGLRRGCQYCLAGETGTGKTGLALGIALNVAARGEAVAIASAEMPTEQLTIRALANRANLDNGELERGELTRKGWNAAGEAAKWFGSLPLCIDDRPAQTIVSIRTMARRAAAKLGKRLGLLVVDYIQILRGERRGRSDSREQEVAELSKGLMWLAKELDCAVLTLSQLNREAAKRGEPPKLHDLRDSGAIEQDNFGVLFVWNRGAREDMGENKTTDCEVILAKHRQGGACGSVPMRFHGPSTRFFEVALEPDGFENDFDGRY